VFKLMKELFLAMIVIFFSTSAYADITTGLIGWWKFDENASGTCSGASLLDSSGNGNNATCNGSPAWAAGHIGLGALNINNGNATYAATGSSAVYNIASTVSITAWVYLLSVAPSYQVVMSTANYAYQMSINTNKLRFYSNNTTPGANPGLTSIATSTWTFLAITWNGSTVTQYINGVVDDSWTYTGSISTGGSTYVVMGNNWSESGDPIDGEMDDLRIYNRALSGSDVTALYNYGLTTHKNMFFNNALLHNLVVKQ